MNFTDVINNRYSCRNYDETKAVEKEKLDAVLKAARIAPSACNGQPYHITVCSNEKAVEAARATMSMGINKFADKAPIILVISEEDYVKTAALGAKTKGNDYRSMDIGILAAYITAEATNQGLASCILGWLNDDKLRKICGLSHPVRLVITLGYPLDEPRVKKRKEITELVSYLGD